MKEQIVYLSSIPDCDICGNEPAIMDGKTHTGQWGYMCQSCSLIHAVGIGLGKGQYIKLKED